MGFERFGYSYFLKVFSLLYDGGRGGTQGHGTGHMQKGEHQLWKDHCKLP